MFFATRKYLAFFTLSLFLFLLGTSAQALSPHSLGPKFDKSSASNSSSTRVRNRADYRLVIFTDDQSRAQAFLRALKARGYSNAKVRGEPNDDFNIKWGQAKSRMVNEILALADSSLGIRKSRFNKKHIFGADDHDIFVNLPFGSSGGSDRAKHKVVIFTDDQDRARPLLKKLKRMGYSNTKFNSPPNSDFNIKWGSATSARVNEIVRAITDTTDIASSRINRKKVFEDDDTDIFINLPFGASGSGSSGRNKHEVIIFTDDESRAEPLVSALKRKGYRARARGNPNDNFNIKWGAASTQKIDEIVSLITSTVDVPRSRIKRKHIFEEDDNKIFVNLPFDLLASSGTRGDYRVVIFSDDRTRARKLERALHSKGYTNTAHRDTPNDNFNIKWGQASSSKISELVSLISSSVDVPRSQIERKHIFEEDDKDIFINLPFAQLSASSGDRSDYRVVIFSSDRSRARKLERALHRKGYSNTALRDTPNDDFNIKWGKASRSKVEEIVRLIELAVDIDADRVDRKHIFEADDTDIFINLPF